MGRKRAPFGKTGSKRAVVESMFVFARGVNWCFQNRSNKQRRNYMKKATIPFAANEFTS